MLFYNSNAGRNATWHRPSCIGRSKFSLLLKWFVFRFSHLFRLPMLAKRKNFSLFFGFQISFISMIYLIFRIHQLCWSMLELFVHTCQWSFYISHTFVDLTHSILILPIYEQFSVRVYFGNNILSTIFSGLSWSALNILLCLLMAAVEVYVLRSSYGWLPSEHQ